MRRGDEAEPRPDRETRQGQRRATRRRPAHGPTAQRRPTSERDGGERSGIPRGTLARGRRGHHRRGPARPRERSQADSARELTALHTDRRRPRWGFLTHHRPTGICIFRLGEVGPAQSTDASRGRGGDGLGGGGADHWRPGEATGAGVATGGGEAELRRAGGEATSGAAASGRHPLGRGSSSPSKS
nr:uncharacterized protein LOC109764470 [Aegilops tauschii subsp. strangulata]